MVIFTLTEIIGIIAVTVIVGYILSGYLQRPKDNFEDLYKKRGLIDWEDVKFGMIIAAPAIILHELAHKFAGLLLGIPSVFNAYWFGLGLGIILKLIGSPFLLLAPAFVSFSQNVEPMQHAIIAFAGPAVNLALWLGTAIYIKYTKKKHSRRTMIILVLTKRINMILFIFNMIPIPPLDGSHVFSNIIKMIS